VHQPTTPDACKRAAEAEVQADVRPALGEGCRAAFEPRSDCDTESIRGAAADGIKAGTPTSASLSAGKTPRASSGQVQ